MPVVKLGWWIERGFLEIRRWIIADMRNYEFTFIVHPDVEDEGVADTTEKVSQLIAEGGGQVINVDHWGRRRLAYPIDKQREGYYVLMQVQLDPKSLGELERNLKLTEEVIRYLLVRTVD
jgi:small subunit ribosomal protein S6